MKQAFNCEQRNTEAHLAIEQSLQGLQQREAEMFHHKTFRRSSSTTVAAAAANNNPTTQQRKAAPRPDSSGWLSPLSPTTCHLPNVAPWHHH